MNNSSNTTTKVSINEQGLTLTEWLRKANVNINFANNTDVTAWRKGQDPLTYNKR